MGIKDSLSEILREKTSGAFLFLGSGFSRRYIGLEDWKGLLQRFCAPGKPFEYYLSKVDGDYPSAAALLASDFNDRWWDDPIFAKSREEYSGNVTSRSSALRYEICKYLSSLTSGFPGGIMLSDEVEAVRRLNVDGVVTTNWDCFAEHLFPDYKVYVGQADLLFANPQEVGEIYKIHGGCSNPDSLVLTDEDYAVFSERNPYLAAKLITIFVEHPVVFIGYSLSDPNIKMILKSISSCIGSENIEKLRRNLIFVNRLKDGDLESVSETYYAFDSEQIPVVLVKTDDFSVVYSALEETKRKVPARVLRLCKEQMYEIVKSSDPSKKISVVDIENISDKDDVEFLVGVGVVSKGVSKIGYESLQIFDLISDLIVADRGYEPDSVLRGAVKVVGRNSPNVPVFKYLNSVGICSRSDYNKSDYKLAKWVDRKVDDFRTKGYKVPFNSKCRGMGLKEVVESFPAKVAVFYIPFLPSDKIDVDLLGQFLRDNFSYFEEPLCGYASPFRKLACFYDRLKWGWKF